MDRFTPPPVATDRPRRLVSIVVPFFNEAEGVAPFAAAMRELVAALPHYRFEIVCVDDGSHDATLPRLVALADASGLFRVIELSRNFGKEAALTAGLDAARGDAIVPMDADLQDPPSLLPALLAEWERGADVVVARRSDRQCDGFLKRKTAEWFYRLHNRVSDIRIPRNVGDFRLMDRKVLDALRRLPERQRFMKGLFAWVGFRTACIDYRREPRRTGVSKFPGWKLWNFALEGITSFSTAPLRIWTYVGFTGAALTLAYAAAIFVRTLLWGVDVPGYASLLIASLFFGSLQLISVGLLGEYIGRIYVESKQRPVYIVRSEYGGDAAASAVRRAPRGRWTRVRAPRRAAPHVRQEAL